MLVAQDRILLHRLDQARAQTDTLFEIVRPDSLYDRPIAERHRIVFYIGHLEAFDWNLLRSSSNLRSFDADLDKLFAFGIDPVDGGLPSDQPSDWPAIEQVRRYAARVRQELDSLLRDAPEILLNTAIEHRLMHAETLAYMLHQLPLEKKIGQPQVDVPAREQPRPESIEIPEGAVTPGLSRHSSDFGWDNEYDAHTVNVPAFAIERYKITNGQYLEFVRAGGYQDRSLWTPADWEWRSADDVSHPAFWKQARGSWHLQTMFEEVPLPLSWPVYVSQAEASAYARWAGKRLPTEAEWQRAAYGSPDRAERSFPWGDQMPSPGHGYFDFERWDPAPVDAFPQGRSAFGLDGLLANGWEWTSTPFGPFEGFKPFPFYEGYSANFFDGKHFVMKGGSPRTDRSMLRRSFRNWFQPHYPYVYAGFRCASNGQK
ncbi:MAG: SUMF1/EgtB/PvdO family nonheme iron enzyme [Acidobacteriia bacterium]|nr:SUMF1/EgtB/PvdO family nonheme iron enzyme [Terriglobia bacterium]